MTAEAACGIAKLILKPQRLHSSTSMLRKPAPVLPIENPGLL